MNARAIIEDESAVKFLLRQADANKLGRSPVWVPDANNDALDYEGAVSYNAKVGRFWLTLDVSPKLSNTPGWHIVCWLLQGPTREEAELKAVKDKTTSFVALETAVKIGKAYAYQLYLAYLANPEKYAR